MESILITGGAGFIGANFVHYWSQRHPEHKVVVLDSLTYAGNLSSIAQLVDKQAVTFAQADICDVAAVDALFAKHGFDTVIHLAAESHVDRSIVEPGAFIRTNVQGTHVLLMAARRAWENQCEGRRFHHVSTDEVYGDLDAHAPGFTEATPYAPRSPYAASKASSDMLVRAYANTYGLPITISNCSNNYGPYQFPEKLIPLMLLNALEGKPLPVYGDGSNVRDWLFVDDHCAGIDAILERGRTGETYNIGGENEIANLELVGRLCDVVGARLSGDATLRARFPRAAANPRDLITFVKDRPGHDRRYAVDTRKISGELGFRPARGFEDGLAATVDWYLRREEWWRPIQSGEYRKWVNTHYGWTE
ncbi:MAG: dTDP-glucose 4,6-dehydratase [Pseudomonadota bacterium]